LRHRRFDPDSVNDVHHSRPCLLAADVSAGRCNLGLRSHLESPCRDGLLTTMHAWALRPRLDGVRGAARSTDGRVAPRVDPRPRDAPYGVEAWAARNRGEA